MTKKSQKIHVRGIRWYFLLLYMFNNHQSKRLQHHILHFGHNITISK